MVYTLAMQLKESLTELLVAKAAARALAEQAEQLRVQEVRRFETRSTAWCARRERERDSVAEMEGWSRVLFLVLVSLVLLPVPILQAELAKPKGTPVTRERFLEWRKKFDLEMAAKRDRELKEEIRNLPP